ncbi:glycosyltransferase [Cyclobacterium xiamenense]|uniref:glycosyltransferase n=1 Tax=Cyclobacterium xiamenense TaxID=1297121 RepID=UPI001386F4DC|nr:glycosyltransferase [Cyclobacterium xiamenense]
MEGKEMRLSIIVPMYKVAPYVERCIRSLANQDMPTEEYEIICVNDGCFAVRGPDVKDPDCSWAILYKSALLKQYQIDYAGDVPYSEDGLLLGKVCSVSKRVQYCDDDFYQRSTRPGSATNSELFYSKQATKGLLNMR